MRVVTVVLVLLCLSALRAPTQEARVRLAGAVVAKDGQAWANAVVTLFSKPDFELSGLDRPDRIVVRSDERGRFRARLLPRRAYTAWAREEGDSERIRITSTVSNVPPGQRLQLKETGPLVPIRVRVVGTSTPSSQAKREEHSSRTERSKLRLQFEDVTGVRTPLALDDRGETTVPPHLGPSGHLLFFYEGKSYYRHSLLRREPARKEHLERLKKQLAAGVKGKPFPGLPDIAKEPLPPWNVERVLVPPPIRISVKVVSAADERPVTGARVACRFPKLESTTDEQGRVEFVVKPNVDGWGRDHGHFGLELFVIAKRFAPHLTGFDHRGRFGKKPLDCSKLPEGRAPQLLVKLAKGYSLRGRIMGPKGQPRKLLCRQTANPEFEPGNFCYLDCGEFLAECDSQGRFEIFGLGKRGNDVTLFIPLLPELRQQLSRDRPAGVPMPRFVRIPVPNVLQVAADVEMQPVALDKLRVMDLVVQAPDGFPSPHAEVVALNKHDHRFAPAARTGVRSDRRGRCRIVFQKEPAIAVFGKDHYFVGELDPASMEQDDSGFYRLSLKPYLTVEGKAVDKKGKPIARASVGCRGTRSLGGEFPYQIGLWNNRFSRGVTDANGHFRLRFIPSTEAAFRFRAWKTVNGRTVNSEDVEVSDESLKDVELVLPMAAAKKRPR